MTLTPDRVVGKVGESNMIEEAHPLRAVTFRFLTMLTSRLVFNKNCNPCSLLHQERVMLQNAFSNAASNLL